MPTFLDESGDTGHQPGSATHFRLAAVWVPTQDVAAAFRESIRALRRRLGLPADYEFKFVRTHHHPERREAFFDEAIKHGFRFAAASVDKREGEWLTADRQAIYWACTVSLASLLRQTYREEEARRASHRPLNELVVVDDNEDPVFMATVKWTFAGLKSAVRPRSPLIDKVKFRGSGPDEMLQLADMTCGAINAHLDGDSRWHRSIASRSVGILRIP
jgi:hypothetical protein